VTPTRDAAGITRREITPRVSAALRLLEDDDVDRDTAIAGAVGLLRAAQRWCEIADFERRLAS
jgi:hypothetical protein